MGPYQLNKDGQIVHVFRSTTTAPDGKAVNRTRGVVGRAGQVFEDLPEHVKRPIENGETGNMWTILGEPDQAEVEKVEVTESATEPVSLTAVESPTTTRTKRGRSSATESEDE